MRGKSVLGIEPRISYLEGMRFSIKLYRLLSEMERSGGVIDPVEGGARLLIKYHATHDVSDYHANPTECERRPHHGDSKITCNADYIPTPTGWWPRQDESLYIVSNLFAVIFHLRGRLHDTTVSSVVVARLEKAVAVGPVGDLNYD